MRVLYVNHTAEVSGAERSLLALLNGLPAGVEARVAAPRGRLQTEVDELGVPFTPIVGTAGSLRLHPLHTPRTIGELALAAAQVRRHARSQHAELLHANSIRAGLVLALARPRTVATVVHVRDCLPPGTLSSATLRLIGARATTVLANSHYTARAVLAAAPHAHVQVAYNPVDTARFDPARIERAAARAALGHSGERQLLIGVVAQLTPWKGQDTAIEALRLLTERGLDAHLLLIGSAKFLARSTRYDNAAYVEKLHRMIDEAGLQECVTWLGERDDVPQLVRALDALLLPSWEEPFGRAVIEAMALEVPVLATNVGGPPEILTDGSEGYLLDPQRAEAWADALAGLAAAPQRATEMGRRGRARVLDAFTVERHVQRVTEIYAQARARVAAANRRRRVAA